MMISSSLSSAVSGLVAATQRINGAASNIANARSAGALPGTAGPAPYAPVQVTQSAVAGGSSGGSGTIAATTPLKPAFTPSYDPTSPFANSQGLVAEPNVDPVQQITELATARQSFAANLKTVQAALSMTDSLLAII